MHTTYTPENRGAVDRISDSIRQALAIADASSDIHDIVESARAALLDAEAVSLFGLKTPHPDFGAVHWIVGRTDLPGGDYLVLAIPERDFDGGAGWPLYSAGGEDLEQVFRQLPPGFCDMKSAPQPAEPEYA
jgi:hypothetical protein